MDAMIQEVNKKVKDSSAIINDLMREIGKVIVGQQYLVERLLMALLADGHILIEGVPVQLIPAYNSLVEEAVQKAKVKKYQGVSTKVLSLEHLLALMIQTGRVKDKERIPPLLQGCKIDKKNLGKILERHHLKEKWEKEIGRI